MLFLVGKICGEAFFSEIWSSPHLLGCLTDRSTLRDLRLTNTYFIHTKKRIRFNFKYLVYFLQMFGWMHVYMEEQRLDKHLPYYLRF